MRRIVLITVFFMIGLVPLMAQERQRSLGVRAIYPVWTQSVDGAINQNQSVINNKSILLGIAIQQEFPLDSTYLSLQSDLIFSWQSFDLSADSLKFRVASKTPDSISFLPTQFSQSTLVTLQVPLLFKYSPCKWFSVFLGPSFTFTLADSLTDSGSALRTTADSLETKAVEALHLKYSPSLVSLSGVVGFEFRIKPDCFKNFSLNIDGRYQGGLTPLGHYTARGNDVGTLSANSYSISIGVTYWR